MKKYISASLAVLIIGLALNIIGAVLTGINLANFDIVPLAEALSNIGFIGAIFSGIVLVAIIIIAAVRGEDKKQ